MFAEIKKVVNRIDEVSLEKVDSKAVVKAERLIAKNKEEFVEFIGLLVQFWQVIKLVCGIVKVFTGKKTDDKIDAFIAKGDKFLA